MSEFDARATELHAALRELLPRLSLVQRTVIQLLYYDRMSERKVAHELKRRGLTKELLDHRQVGRLRAYAIRQLRVALAEWAGASRDEYTLARMSQAQEKGVKFDEVVRVDGGQGASRVAGGDG
jgi:hypothetical protein